MGDEVNVNYEEADNVAMLVRVSESSHTLWPALAIAAHCMRMRMRNAHRSRRRRRVARDVTRIRPLRPAYATAHHTRRTQTV